MQTMNASHDQRQQDQKRHFHELLVGFDNAMLVTRSTAGELRARPMAIAQVEADNDLWFVTGMDSGKIDEIAGDAHVCVTFQSGSQFASLSGRASVVRDAKKIDQLWNEAWKVWFPEGKSDPSLVLLRVEGQEGEYWDRSGVRGLKYLFQAGKGYLQGTRPEIDQQQQHRKIDL